MLQTSPKKLFAVAMMLAAFFANGIEVEGQTTFRACRVPDVGAIYMIGVTGTPTDCLDPSHVEFSWTEGGVPADGSITTAKLANGAVTQAKLDPGITLGVGPGDIGTTELADGAVTQAKLDPGITLGVGPGDIGTTELADNAVTSIKIADGTIIGADMVGGTVGTAELALNAVTTDQIADGTIIGADLAIDAVGSTELLDGSIGTADIADGAVTSIKIANGTIVAADIAADAVGASEITAGAVGTSEIVNGAVTSAKLAVLPVASYAPGDFNTGVDLLNTYLDINSVSITVGGPGSIVVDGIAHLEVNGTTCNYTYYGIAETSSAAPSNVRTFQNRPDYGAVGVSTYGYVPMVSQYLDVVAGAGTYTYYFTANRSDAVLGICKAYPRGMTAMFFPS